jgi:hypothetical protein
MIIVTFAHVPVECFPQRVHIGMDCFPAVSFTKTSGVEFDVNMSGPFKFDVSAIPDYRADKTNRFQQIPSEIVSTCLSLATTQPANALVFRQVRALAMSLDPLTRHRSPNTVPLWRSATRSGSHSS